MDKTIQKKQGMGLDLWNNSNENTKSCGENDDEQDIYENNEFKERDSNIVFESAQVNNKGWEIEEDEKYSSELKKKKLKFTKNLFIQMEYCEGETLKEMIDRHEISEDKIKFKLIRQILEALWYIHNKQMIHRDLKPSNIFLDKSNQVKLGDFGLATVTQTKTLADTLLNKKEFINIMLNNKSNKNFKGAL